VWKVSCRGGKIAVHINCVCTFEVEFSLIALLVEYSMYFDLPG
jgi:hypothetical protein